MLSPSPCVVGQGDSVNLTATATMPDGGKQNVTTANGVDWSTGNSNTAAVNASGTVVGVNPVVTEITAGYHGATGTIDCTVGP